ncbi:hypothetical protein SAMN05519103_08507 [Rhizobiales bacterium GAS113]|nr:hypothetical protein SAMN05519103_08507 [Rhizobiales bacterium GAS113]
MAKVTVYKVQLYDVMNDAPVISRRLATRKGAARMGGEIVDGSAIEIDASQLEPGEEWTPRGFDPHAVGESGCQYEI